MDKKVLKGVTIFLMFFTIVVLVVLFQFPKMSIGQKQLYADMGSEDFRSKVDEAALTRPDEVVKQEDASLGQLEIQLPKETDKDRILIKSNPMTQEIYIQIPNGGADYFNNYAIRGKSDHIESMAYYEQNNSGIILLKMDQIYEVKQTILEESLYIDFADPHEVYDKIIVIDAGHGSKAVGAVSHGTYEKDINLAILLELKQIFEEHSDEKIGVYYTRTDDSNPTLLQRVQLANDLNANLFISIHNNTSKSGSGILSGTQVMYKDGGADEAASKRLAEICLENVSREFESRSIGLLDDNDTYIICNSKVPAALIEVGFMTNNEELKKLESQEYQKKAAEGVYEAINQALEEGY